MTTTSQAIAKRDEGPGALIEKYRDDFALVLPSHVQASQWVRLSQGLLRRNRELATVAAKNPGSFLAALLDCARLGLEPGDTYHLVPFGNEVTGIVDYTGEIELAYRSGAVSSIVAEVVYSGDTFTWVPGQMDRPQHAPDWFGERGQMIGAYAYAVMKDGATSRVVVMSEADINAVRAVSKTAGSGSSPWKKWPDRMWLKTVVHQLAKWIPTSAEYRQQVLKSEAAVADVTIGHDLPPLSVDHEDTSASFPADDEIAVAEVVE